MNMPTRAFLHNYKLSISTLSPVHIGCSEDFEPTNYVMDEQCLHFFDAYGLAELLSDDDRKKLEQINQSKAPLLALQKFFYDRKDALIALKRVSRLVAPDLYKKYNNVVGKAANVEQNGRQVVNALEIARTSYSAHSLLPIIPGSSLKGAIRTALLNEANGGRRTVKKPRELEKELLAGAFQTDPLRLVKIADANFVADQNVLYPKIAFENNVKRIPPKGGKPTRQLLCLMREVIPEYNFDAFRAELTIQDLLGIKSEVTPASSLSIAGIANACNRFYQGIFKRELERFITRGCIDLVWAERADTLLKLLAPFISADAGMILRVGRHSGAESVTLDGVRSIKINKGPGKSPSYENQSTTDWLVGDQEKSETNLMPFGWVFIDFGDSRLQTYREKFADFMRSCSSKALSEQNRIFAQANERQRLLKAQQEELLRKSHEIFARQREEQLAEDARQEAFAAMPVEQQKMQEFRNRVTRGEDKNGGAGSKLATDFRIVCDEGANWSAEFKSELYALALDLLKHIGVDRKNDKWKPRLAKLQ